MSPVPCGRPSAVSQDIIRASVLTCEKRDLQKNSCTSAAEVMCVVNRHRREELERLGSNPRAKLPSLSRSTMNRIVRRVTPISISNGSIQNTSRQKVQLVLCYSSIGSAHDSWHNRLLFVLPRQSL